MAYKRSLLTQRFLKILLFYCITFCYNYWCCKHGRTQTILFPSRVFLWDQVWLPVLPAEPWQRYLSERHFKRRFSLQPLWEINLMSSAAMTQQKKEKAFSFTFTQQIYDFQGVLEISCAVSHLKSEFEVKGWQLDGRFDVISLKGPWRQALTILNWLNHPQRCNPISVFLESSHR